MPTEFPTPASTTRRRLLGAGAAASLASLALPVSAQTSTPAFTPQVGQSGKDVIWVPTPDALVDRMLRMAQVTPEDFVVDLGSGDGKIVIAAARDFKARSLGVEFNPDMVALSRRNAEAQGVSSRARFDQGDIFTYDFTAASVVTMYLLPGLNLKLRPQLLRMRPGTRLVTHQFTMGSWEPDDSTTVENRPGYLWIVPAAVGGSWKLTTTDSRGSRESSVAFSQVFQQITGTSRMSSMEGRLRATRLTGDRIDGLTQSADGVNGSFVATRVGAAQPVDAGRD